MLEEFKVLKLVCNSLEQAGISYMLTGSFASNFYTIPRMTRDIDIVVEILKPDVEKFFHAFEKDFFIDQFTISDAIQHQGMFNIIHNDTVVKVDFIIRKHSPYRATEFRRRNRVQFGDTPLWIVSLEDLILSKLFWAKDSFSNLQLNDVKKLLESPHNLNMDYIHEWVDSLELKTVFEKVKSYE
jgi:hypothetical protein